MTSKKQNKIIIVTGQTATGKTSLALKLAKKINGELVNCDSRQIYKYLDIITGKDLTNGKFKRVSKLGNFDLGYYELSDRTPAVEEVKTRIWLYDIVDPK